MYKNTMDFFLFMYLEIKKTGLWKKKADCISGLAQGGRLPDGNAGTCL